MKKFNGIYLITDETLISQEDYSGIIESVLKHKPEFIQLRVKNLDKIDILSKAKKIREISLMYGVKFIVNDFIDVALDCGADGVHIGEFDDSLRDVRAKIGNNKIIGVSCYGDLDRCIKFSELGADYIAIGTPYFTKTKPNRERTSLEEILSIVDRIRSTSIFAIGGIDASNAANILSLGVDGIAVINSVFGSENPSESVRELTSLFKRRI
jgi:thiamine-phosphate pyrophosphorylase|tara:strand:+ start:8316 stop:8948 length:633 start_codon:yes stop_codon:yes gene_type:complete